jgi:hypothetical protein
MAEITTFKQAQAEAMRRATKADLDEFDAEALLRRILRQNDIPLPKSMAPDQDSSGRINPDKKAKGGMAKKAQMMRGGMANKKEHMYAAGGSVTDKLSPGLKALNKTRPDVVKKILG